MNQEYVVLVDANGKPTGETLPKLEAHHAKTPFHLAFSCYVFNEQGKLLLTQRAKSKKVWPGVWTNSICGHPAPSEDMVDAIKRRLDYELGMSASDFEIILPNYTYKTPPFNGIIENEFCPVYFARTNKEPKPNSDEVEAYKWVSWDDFIKEAEADRDNTYSYWCKDQLKQLKKLPDIAIYTKNLQ